MASIREHVRGYLTSSGFRILQEQDAYLVADKLVFGQDRDTWLVWTVPEEVDTTVYEPVLRDSITSTRPNYPDAKACVLAKSRGGFSHDLLQVLSQLRVKFLVPVWFFDSPFKVEDAPKAASVIADVRSQAAAYKRVPQPFRMEEENEGDESDLLHALRSELPEPTAPAVHVIVGRAGIGKSVLFNALFDRLYGDFLTAKAEQRSGMPRPIPLLPEHLKGIYSLRTELLVDNFLRTDVAAPVVRETFEWLLVNGFSAWLLDGLDELYAGDPGFFDYLLDLMTRPDSRAQVVICCRDSLLTTSDAFANFRDWCTGTAVLRVYRLSEWDRSLRRKFAWTRLEGRLPAAGDHDTGPIKSFLVAIERSDTLRSLATLPLYCDILLKQHQAGELREFADDVQLLSHVIDRMIQRELEKGNLDLRLFEDNGLEEWLEQIALDYVEGQRSSDISRDRVMEYAELVVRPNLDGETRRHILASLLQFPLFREGGQTGHISFAHDLLADVLAARAYLRLLPRRPAEVAERLARIDIEDPMLLRFMASKLDRPGEECLVQEINRGGISGRSFAVALTLLLLARPERDVARRVGASLEGQNLAGVRFVRRDLSSLSFRQSDLSQAVFADCDLRGSQFEGAFLSRTKFEGNNDLRGAQFGDLSRIESVWVGRSFYEDPDKVRSWMAEATGSPPPAGEACPTAIQILHMFGKFITPLGRPRRDMLQRVGLLAGKRFAGAAAVEACIDDAVRCGYLSAPDYRDRFRRAEGDKYAEMVEFVSKHGISDGIGRLIAGLCPKRGCQHRLAP